MILELNKSDFSAVRHIFMGHKYQLPVQAIIQGHYPGKIFVDHPDAPRTALAWAFNRWAYIGGDPDNAMFTQGLASLMKSVIVPESHRLNHDWLEIYISNGDDSEQWSRTIERDLGEFNPVRHQEMLMVFDKQRYLRNKKVIGIPNGYKLMKVDIPIIPPELADTAFVSADYLSITAIGYSILKGTEVIATCSSNGFEIGREFMIEIETFIEQERKRGLATLAGQALIEHCIAHDLIPYWETNRENVPSWKVAERLGFATAETYPVYQFVFPSTP